MCRDQTQMVVQQFLIFIEDQNFEGHREILTKDCAFPYPHAAEDAPKEIFGREQIIEQTRVGGWKTRREMKVLDVGYAAVEDPEWAPIQWRNKSTTDDGKPYEQTFVNAIRLVDGKIKEFIEYYAPVVELAAGNPCVRTTDFKSPSDKATSQQGRYS